MSTTPVNSAPSIFSSLTAGSQSYAQPSLEEEVLALFATLRVSLLRYAISFGLSMHDAEDLIQEVFLALFHHLRQDRSRSNLRGWVFRVTHNLALKRRARLGAENRLHEGDLFTEQHLFDATPDPESQLLFHERHTRLLSVFKALPNRDQCCLRLRAEGLRYREIAQVLKMSLGSVSTSITRSIHRLESSDR